MTAPHVIGLRRRLASAALSVSLLGGAALPAVVMAPAAAAHSVLLSVDPGDGATVEESPDTVVLTFNEEINQSFATVAVTTAEDRTNLAAEPVVDGDSVSVGLDALDAGTYTVGYRVTSADGHVISGSSSFTVAASGGAAESSGTAAADADAGAPTAAQDSATSSETGDAGASGDQTDEAASSSTDDSATSGFGTALWVVGGLGVLLIGGGFVLLRRGK